MNRYYGIDVIPSHKTIKFTLIQRIERAIKYRKFKLLFVKEIEVPNRPIVKFDI